MVTCLDSRKFTGHFPWIYFVGFTTLVLAPVIILLIDYIYFLYLFLHVKSSQVYGCNYPLHLFIHSFIYFLHVVLSCFQIQFSVLTDLRLIYAPFMYENRSVHFKGCDHQCPHTVFHVSFMLA